VIAVALQSTHAGWSADCQGVALPDSVYEGEMDTSPTPGPCITAKRMIKPEQSQGLGSTFNQHEEATMKSKAIAVLLVACALCPSIGTLSYAQEVKGPTQFNLAILDEHSVSFVVPSALIVDERGKVSGITFTVTNYTKKDQGFAIDKVRVKEVVKPGETKTIKLSVTDLDAIGTDQSVFPYYSHIDPKHIGGLLYIKR
jgi:hypothetical protein